MIVICVFIEICQSIFPQSSICWGFFPLQRLRFLNLSGLDQEIFVMTVIGKYTEVASLLLAYRSSAMYKSSTNDLGFVFYYPQIS